MFKAGLILLFILTINLSAQPEKKKAMWIVRYALLDQQETEQIIHAALLLKTTDIYVQVRASAQLLFEKEQELAAFSQWPAAKNFIKLRNEAALRNIKVHAWLNILNIWSSPKLPADSAHLVYKSSTSILRAWSDRHTPIKKLHKLGIEGYFLDPADARNLEHIKAIIKLLAEEYMVDGIHLDYFRYPSLQVASSPSLRTRFILREYLDPEIIYASKAQRRNKRISTPLQMDRLYKAFLRNNLTHLLGNIRMYINGLKRKPQLSIAVKPHPAVAKAVYFQNWAQWLKDHLCDYVVTMNYAPDAETFMENLEACSALNLKNKIILGISVYNQGLNSVLDKIERTRLHDFAGYSIFSYNSLKKQDMIRKLYRGLSASGAETRRSLPKGNKTMHYQD